MKKLIIITIVFTAFCLINISEPVYAHVFFKDETGQVGLIMHATPDDDPIAGETTNIYFDIQDSNINNNSHNFELSITDSKGIESIATSYPSGGTKITANYIFPYQGSYQLKLQAIPIKTSGSLQQKPTTFVYTQGVFRGKSLSPLDKQRYVWAEAGLVASTIGLALLLVVVLVQRKEIARYTNK